MISYRRIEKPKEDDGMKENVNKYVKMFCMVIGVFLISSLLCGRAVLANTIKEIGKVDNRHFIGDVNNTSVTLTRNGSLMLSFQEDSYGEFSIVVMDSKGTTIFNTEYDFCFESRSFTMSNLKAGSYSILLTRENDVCDCFLDIYGIYVPNNTYPEFSLSKSTLNIEKKKSETLQIKAIPSSVAYTVVWKSNKNKIASVNNAGMVKANSIGTAKISANIYLNGKLYQTLLCTVVVKTNWKYKNFSVAMKKYAIKHKNLTYKDIDKCRVCRLYSIACSSTSTKHLKTRGFASGIYYVFYIELKKSGNKLTLKLYAENSFVQMDINDEVELNSEQFKMRSSNRIMNFDLSILKDTSYYSRKGYYFGRTKSRAV